MSERRENLSMRAGDVKLGILETQSQAQSGTRVSLARSSMFWRRTSQKDILGTKSKLDAKQGERQMRCEKLAKSCES